MSVHGRALCSPLPSSKHRFNAAALSPEIYRCPHEAVAVSKRSGALCVGRSSEALAACSTAQPLLHARCEKHLVYLCSTPGTSKAATRIYWDLDNLKPLPGPQGLRTLTALKAWPSMALFMCSALMPAIPWHHESARGLLLRIYRGAFIWRHMCACRNVQQRHAVRPIPCHHVMWSCMHIAILLLCGN